MRVMVTGFGPFLDNAVNPSDALARAIGGRSSDHVRFVSHSPLPVAHAHAARLAITAAQRARVQAVVAFGLAAGTPRIQLETVARNVSTSEHADATGRRRVGRPVLPGAPPTLRSTLDVGPIRSALRASGIPASLSSDAGGYVCNDLFYRLLHAQPIARMTFIHVPAHVRVAQVAGPLARGIARAVIASVRDVSR